MTDKDRATELEESLRKAREDLFAPEELDREEIERRFTTLQKEVMYLRSVLSLTQERGIKLAKRKCETIEELTLFQGELFYITQIVLRELGATEEDIHSMLYGDEPEDSETVKYVNMCVEFARAAERMHQAVDELREARQQAQQEELLDSILSVVSSRAEDEVPDKKDLN